MTQSEMDAAVWHSDGAYIEDSTTITMLHAKEVPINGGETLIADLVSAYEDLDKDFKEEIENLIALHFYGKAEFDKDEHVPAPIRTKKQKDANPICEKPIVMKHPYSGKKSLYGITHSPFKIVGKSEDETKEILKKLKILQPKKNIFIATNMKLEMCCCLIILLLCTEQNQILMLLIKQEQTLDCYGD